MIGKLLLLASAALAIGALAAPTAVLAVWTHEGEPLEGEASLTFSGPTGFAMAVAEAGWEADFTAKVILGAESSTGQATEVMATDCKGTGKLAGTVCTSTFENLPWTVHALGFPARLVFTNIKLTNHYYNPVLDPKHETPLQTTVLTGNIVATPDNREAIGTVSLTGEGTLVNGATPATIGGDLLANPFGTYGF